MGYIAILSLSREAYHIQWAATDCSAFVPLDF